MDADEHRAYIRKQFLDECNASLPLAAATLALDTDDPDVRLVLVELCNRMFNAGIRVGATQAIAQAVEQGAEVHVNMDPILLPPYPEE